MQEFAQVVIIVVVVFIITCRHHAEFLCVCLFSSALRPRRRRRGCLQTYISRLVVVVLLVVLAMIENNFLMQLVACGRDDLARARNFQLRKSTMALHARAPTTQDRPSCQFVVVIRPFFCYALLLLLPFYVKVRITNSPSSSLALFTRDETSLPPSRFVFVVSDTKKTLVS